MLMCHCLNTPISLLHFSFTLLEHDSISKYYEKSHAQKKIAFILLQNAKTSCPHQPSTILSPSCGRTSCDSHLHPWANRAWPFSSDHWNTCISRAQCSQVSALLLPTFSRTSALCKQIKNKSWNGSYSLYHHRYLESEIFHLHVLLN